MVKIRHALLWLFKVIYERNCHISDRILLYCVILCPVLMIFSKLQGEGLCNYMESTDVLKVAQCDIFQCFYMMEYVVAVTVKCLAAYVMKLLYYQIILDK